MFKKSLVSIFILINFLMMVRAQLPANAPVIEFAYKPITFIQDSLSMWRGWKMFSPNPLKANSYIDAQIVYNDGRQALWEFPYPSADELFKRYVWGERFRKYLSEGVRLDNNKHLWEDAAKYVLSKQSNAQEISKIILSRRWSNIDDWKTGFKKHRELSTKFFKYDFYTYEVEHNGN